MTAEASRADQGPFEPVLDFWFAPGRERQWFAGDKAFDAAVAETLEPWHRQAVAGDLEDWREASRGALALVLLLDQVPRQLYRGQAQAFACDARARAVADGAVARGYDRLLTLPERLFLYLPFEHSEDLADQERALALIETLGDAEWTRYAALHRDIIARFGRFPHRNAALGRETTEEEAAFLLEPDSSF